MAGSGIDVNIWRMVAASVDFTDYLGGRLPLFFAVVLTLSFLLLMMVFRSIVVPIKAVIMNILSLGASFGIVLAWIFQEAGHRLSGRFRLRRRPRPVDAR